MKSIQELNPDILVMDAPFVQEMMEVTYNMWHLGWDERNGGNISYILRKEEVMDYLNPQRVLRTIPLDFPVVELANEYFIVTGSGKFFKNVKNNPADCLGVIRVNNEGNAVELLWGLSKDGKPTSELASHFISHVSRLKQDPNHRVIMHTHATNLIAMTFTHELDEKSFSKTLWKMCTECIVVFPEGIKLLPWMIPGTNKIGEATAKKMKEARLVVWPYHGIFGAGESIDDAFSLIETAEKAAQVYMLASAHRGGIIQGITDEELISLAEAFKVEPNKNYL